MTPDEARLEMVHELHHAVYGNSWARPETPEQVWRKLLAEVAKCRIQRDENLANIRRIDDLRMAEIKQLNAELRLAREVIREAALGHARGRITNEFVVALRAYQELTR